MFQINDCDTNKKVQLLKKSWNMLVQNLCAENFNLQQYSRKVQSKFYTVLENFKTKKKTLKTFF